MNNEQLEKIIKSLFDNLTNITNKFQAICNPNYNHYTSNWLFDDIYNHCKEVNKLMDACGFKPKEYH